MTPIKVSPEEIRLARKAGFRKKKPKKPKMSASTHVKERWITSRWNPWAKEVKSKAAEGRKKEKLDNAIRSA